MFKRIIFFIVIMGVSIMVPFTSMCQPADPCPDPNLFDCPIDSNLVLLMVAAAGIAAKKAYDHKKKTHTVALS